MELQIISDGKLSLPLVAAGTYPLSIYFAGDDSFINSTKSADLKVTAIPKISVASLLAFYKMKISCLITVLLKASVL